MYCEKCGTEKNNGKCPNCTPVKTVVDAAYNVYVFVATVATLLILRLLTQESRTVPTQNSWRSRYKTEYYVPGNIQGVMVILLCVSAFIMFKLYNGKKCAKLQTILMLIAEIALGLLITFVKFS